MVAAQAAMEARLMLRNGEQLLLAVVIPVIVLIGGVKGADQLGLDLSHRPVDVFTPGVLALAVMSTAFTSLAIATGFERRYGVIKRLGSSPLPRSGLLAGKVGGLLFVEALQLAVISVVGLLLGWDPANGFAGAAAGRRRSGPVPSPPSGCSWPGVLRAEATLAAANLVYLLLLAGGAVVLPSSSYGAFGTVTSGSRPVPSAMPCATPASTAASPGATSVVLLAGPLSAPCSPPGPSSGSEQRLSDPWLRLSGCARWATLVANILLIVTGGAVRLTGSGLGCPTWPRCTDSSFTPHGEIGPHQLVEFGNRTLTFVLVAIAVATFVAARQHAARTGRGDLLRLSVVLALAIPAQALLGGVTVLTDLNPWVVSLHLVLSLIIVSVAVLFLHRLDHPPVAPAGGVVPALAWTTYAVDLGGYLRRDGGHRLRAARR